MGIEGKAVLLVEDDANDAFFLQFAFEQAGVVNVLHVVGDGQEAISYLAGEGVYADRSKHPFPCLVLLDLKLPVVMGMDVLRWVRERAPTLLVLVLTSSSDVGDIDEAYRLGARSYLIKPLGVEQRLELVALIKRYWLEINTFPSLGGCRSEPGKPSGKGTMDGE
jgi:DNA-binding response OmpR family regulator